MPTRSQTISVLGPVDPSSLSPEPSDHEKEKSAPWIVRKLVGSMTGRIVMSSYESLRAAGTSVICLSPWGDSSPLLLPCIRFRDLAVHTVIVATGGMAALAAPVMGPVSEVVIGALGDSVLVEVGLHAGFDIGVKAANDLVFEKPLKHIIPIHSKRLETTGVKVLLITLKYHHAVVEDAALGFYRSSVHKDTSLFASVKNYLAVQKGWFSPYLFASARRPIIPRTMKPDVIFCHGPFLQGDYRVGETLLAESALAITLCAPPPQPEEPKQEQAALSPPPLKKSKSTLSLKSPKLSLPSLSNMFPRSRAPSPEPALTPLPAPPVPRRTVILLVGLKPHRKLWTTSARPGESVINYVLCNGCPAVVVPAKVGAPLLAWDGLTLEQLWRLELPDEGNGEGGKGKSADGRFEGVVNVMCEYLELCVDWERVIVPQKEGGAGGEEAVDGATKKEAVRDAITLLLAAAVRTQTSKEVKKEIEADRCGIAMWRIP
ncbi:hypothetical protein LshimejAT787_0604420 [Lyophyllum shimeji]|uniref:Uncharacterized protein n=1 Tax=Lyophyllum shimeji TaxID=47721 RepID=A0A9P3UPQ5_LYOSH|nr:hypothetical protein LshimejAT787_0604420 [Lyophyllum shimeji]